MAVQRLPSHGSRAWVAEAQPKGMAMNIQKNDSKTILNAMQHIAAVRFTAHV